MNSITDATVWLLPSETSTHESKNTEEYSSVFFRFVGADDFGAVVTPKSEAADCRPYEGRKIYLRR